MLTPQQEESRFHEEVRKTREFFGRERWRYTIREHTAEDVVALRGTLPPQNPQSGIVATKLYNLLRNNFNKSNFVHTFGCLDPIQVAQMSKYLECVYVSGWQCSSTASTTNEPGPDFADYPSNTVSNKVDQLFRAQLFHDRKQHEERSRMSLNEKRQKPMIDYLRPIIADGDCGFGGVTSVMKLMRLMIEAGASGVHIEDQKAGAKKCGHLGGKVLVPVCEHINRLQAFRLQADILGTETVIVARTDAVSAAFLENNIDERDHPYIAGVCDNSIIPYAYAKDKTKWLDEISNKLIRYPEAVAAAMRKDNKSSGLIKKWLDESYKLGHNEARRLAGTYGYGNLYWNCEIPRSNEGYYRIVGGTDYATMRAIAFSGKADMIWMETSKPDLKQAIEFSNGVRRKYPNQMLAYNLSPSFNWDLIDDNEIKILQSELGKLGFVWQFITLAGFHLNSLATDLFAREYSKYGVIKYVEMIQRQERKEKVETLTHQKWSGTELKDRELTVATGGTSSTGATSGATEDQFAYSKSKL